MRKFILAAVLLSGCGATSGGYDSVQGGGTLDARPAQEISDRPAIVTAPEPASVPRPFWPFEPAPDVDGGPDAAQKAH